MLRKVWRFDIFGIPFAVGYSIDWTLWYKPLYGLIVLPFAFTGHPVCGFWAAIAAVGATELDQGFQQRWNWGAYFGLLDMLVAAVSSYLVYWIC